MGTILSGYLVGKSKNVDIRKEGSGNVGTTNTMRILGIKAGVFTLLCDCLKPIVAVGIVWLLLRDAYPKQIGLLQLYAAFGAILGHDFPVFMKFKGGKGIATSFGMLIAIFPVCLPLCVIAFAVSVAATRYVSLGSIMAAVVFAVEMPILGYLGYLPFSGTDLLEAEILGLIAAVLAIWLHRSNIVRLLHGNENKLTFSRK